MSYGCSRVLFQVAVWHDDAKGELLASSADALVVRDDDVLGVVDWKSDVAPSSEDKGRYARPVSDYIRATGAVVGAIVFVTTREIVWVGQRDAMFDRLVN